LLLLLLVPVARILVPGVLLLLAAAVSYLLSVLVLTLVFV